MSSGAGSAVAVRRLQHLPGELLRGGDLGSGRRREEVLRRLHVMAMHGVWGVAAGLDVPAPHAGDRSVGVGPGAAYDATGRLILCPDAVSVPLPTLPDTTSRWADLLVFASTENARVRPRWRWSLAGPAIAGGPQLPLADDVRLGLEIPLARVVVVPGTPPTAADGVDLSTRHVAHGLVRPRIAVDVLLPGTVGVSGYVGSWTVWVDTRAAGFAQVPSYSVGLEGDPLAAYLPVASRDPALVGPFLSITQATADGFELGVWFGWPESDAAASVRVLQFQLISLPVTVRWTGVEPVQRRS